MLSRTSRISLAAPLALFLAGCGGGAPSTSPQPIPPHGGNVFPIPDGLGHVEFVVKANADPAKSKNGPPTVFAAYFLNPDRTAPLSPAPTDVRFNSNVPGGVKTYALLAKGDGFESEPAPYRGGTGIDGELTCDLGGKRVTIPILVR